MELQTSLFLFVSSLVSLSVFILTSYLSKRGDDLEPLPLLGHLPQFMKHRHHFHDWITGVLAASPGASFVIHRMGNVRVLITANPANVEHILKANSDNYPKGPRFRAILRDFFGDSAFSTDGPEWKSQRQAYSVEFGSRSFRDYVVRTVQLETDTRLVPLLARAAEARMVVDMQDLLERYAFDNICTLAFDEDPACLQTDGAGVSAFGDAFRDAVSITRGRLNYLVPEFWKVKRLLGIGSERKLKESTSIVNQFAKRVIRSRVEKTALKPHIDDLLSRYVDGGQQQSEEFLRDAVVGFILAGRESTSSALTWFFWLLSSRPDVVRRILDEIARVRALAGNRRGSFGVDEMREMQYLHAALTESLRLYPAVPANIAWCANDDVLPDGTEVKKGWTVGYNSYAMGRIEANWGKDCREYRPERWLDEAGVFRPESPFKFPAFHGGPRMCLGKEVAYIQMKSIAASVIERFVIELAEKDMVPEKTLSLTLRMKGGLPVRVNNRCPQTP